MSMLKVSALLVAYAAVVLQTSSSSAAPARAAAESLTDRLALMDYEARRLLSAIVRNVVQMTAEELEPTGDDSSVTAQKRACNTATCVTHRLADSLSRTGGMGRSGFIRTDVGPDAFGRRRRTDVGPDGGMGRSGFIRTDVGPDAFGRRRRRSWARERGDLD